MRTKSRMRPASDNHPSRSFAILSGLMAATFFCAMPALAQSTTCKVLGWNNLGMHCMDNDFSVFSILPPYNTIHAQIVKGDNGQASLMGNGTAWTVKYKAIADPSGSLNRTSIGKGNFWRFVFPLFGVALAPDQGLPIPGPSYFMPGSNNVPRRMRYESAAQWYAAYGIPITPLDDNRRKNAYPLMRLVANKSGVRKALTDIVLPVSDEMDCRACHASGGVPAAEPARGWVAKPNPERDQRLNILSKHDDSRLSDPVFQAALTANGYSPAGLLATVITDGTPILCAACHRSEALPGSGLPDIPSLTESIHSLHATVTDPATGGVMDNAANRTACYRCHPGAVTRCLRGIMGNAVKTNGVPAIQCQSCHGSMSMVGSGTRTGWLDEPNCQACHTGTATDNAGAIRYRSAFSSPGVMRTAGVTDTFATNPDTPDAGHSLFRYSRGHGGLYCSACHGSTHAEFPAFNRNDNLYSLGHQGYAGVLSDCQSCHAGQPSTVNGGPHGLHPLGQSWVNQHEDHGESANCRACHGVNGEGTVLSRARTTRTLTAFDGRIVRRTWPGYTVSCYTCHRGPDSESRTLNQPPTVANRTVSTRRNANRSIVLSAVDADGPQTPRLRVVMQPMNGTVGLRGNKATYYPMPGFAGSDSFTYAASDSQLDSNLGTVTVTVSP